MTHYQLLVPTWPGARGRIHLDPSCPRRDGSATHYLTAQDVNALHRQNHTCPRTECQASIGLSSARYAVDLDVRIAQALDWTSETNATTIALHEHDLKIISSEVAGLVRKGRPNLDPDGFKALSRTLKKARKEWKEQLRSDTFRVDLLRSVEDQHGGQDHVVLAARYQRKMRPFNSSSAGKIVAALVGSKSTEGFVLQGSRGAMHWLSTGIGSGVAYDTTWQPVQLAAHEPLTPDDLETITALYTPAGTGTLRDLSSALEALAFV